MHKQTNKNVHTPLAKTTLCPVAPPRNTPFIGKMQNWLELVYKLVVLTWQNVGRHEEKTHTRKPCRKKKRKRKKGGNRGGEKERTDELINKFCFLECGSYKPVLIPQGGRKCRSIETNHIQVLVSVMKSNGGPWTRDQS